MQEQAYRGAIRGKGNPKSTCEGGNPEDPNQTKRQINRADKPMKQPLERQDEEPGLEANGIMGTNWRAFS